MQQSKLELAKNAEVKGIKHTNAKAVSFFSSILDRLLHFLDYIIILRPLLLIPGWTMLLLGYYKGFNGENISQMHQINLPFIGNMPVLLHPGSEILITLFLYSLPMGAIYILNQLIDSHTDEVNGKLYLVAQEYVRKSVLIVQIGVLLSTSVIISLLKFSKTYTYLVILSIILGVLYSVPPVKLKGRPILDLLANASGFGVLAFAVGWVSRSSLSMDLILKCIPYVICVSAAYINTTIPDIEGDVKSGDITTGIFLGIRNSCIISTLLVCIVPMLSWFLRDPISLVSSLFSLPFFVYMTVSNWNEQSPKISAITLATKVSLLALSLLIAVFIPFYFILLILTILLVKIYYQLRFGINYP